MLAKRIIPCLDIDKGRVVKGVNFVNLIDAGDPVETAKAYDKIGADEIVFLDITASSDGRNTAVDILSRASEQVFIPLTVGGGIRSVEDFRKLLSAGADKIAVNSAAIQKPRTHHRGGAQIRLAVRGSGGGRQGERARLVGRIPEWRPREYGVGRHRVDNKGGKAGRGRGSAHQHGQGRHQVGLRHRAYPPRGGRAAREEWRTSPRCSPRARRTRRSRLPSFISAKSRCGRSNNISRGRVSP